MNRMPSIVLAVLLAAAPVAPAIEKLDPVRKPASRAGRGNTVEQSLQRTRKICRTLETVRGLKFRKEVPIDIQSHAAFRDYVETSLERQFGENGEDNYLAGLLKLGVLKESFDLSETVVTLLESQAAAHYSPEEGTYYLLMTNMPALLLDITSAHELYHALQDQHFDLKEFLEGDLERLRDNGDLAAARQCLVEGEATLAMTLWMMMDQLKVTDPQAVSAIASVALRVQAVTELDDIVALSIQRMDALGPGAESMVQALKDVDTLPRFLVETLYASYLKGGTFVDQVRQQGGWDAVAALYTNPPTSTEQILHPEKIMGAQRDEPVDVRIRDLAARLPRGWELLEQDVLGELGLGIFLRLWQDADAPDPAGAASVAAGWGGDRYYYCRGPDEGRDLLIWQTAWDTENDASEFAVAYRMTLSMRFKSMKRVERSSEDGSSFQVWEVEPGRFLKLVRKGKEVAVIDTTERDLLGILSKP